MIIGYIQVGTIEMASLSSDGTWTTTVPEMVPILDLASFIDHADGYTIDGSTQLNWVKEFLEDAELENVRIELIPLPPEDEFTGTRIN